MSDGPYDGRLIVVDQQRSARMCFVGTPFLSAKPVLVAFFLKREKGFVALYCCGTPRRIFNSIFFLSSFLVYFFLVFFPVVPLLILFETC